MPVILNVTGPHRIAWAAAGSVPSTAYLGRADNDDLFSLEIEYKYQDIYTNELGTSPANSILMGATAFVNFTMVAYDPTVILNVFEKLDGVAATGNYVFPSVGKLVYDATAGNRNLIALKVVPDGSGFPTYTVDNCRLITHTLKDVGNKPTRAAFRFEVMPGAANANIFTTGTS